MTEARGRPSAARGVPGPLAAALLAGLCAACVVLLASAAAASAAVRYTVTPRLPSTLTVGQSGVAAALEIDNTSTGAEAWLPSRLTMLTLVPACGSMTLTSPDCPSQASDPGVLRLSTTGRGEPGTACAGVPVAIGDTDPSQDRYRIIAIGGLLLGATGTPAASCTIDFTVNVLKSPTHDADPSAPGLQTDQAGFASGLALDLAGGSAIGTGEITIDRGSAPIATQVTPASTSLGSSFTDTATLAPPTGAAVPTGAVTFDVYGPGDPTCRAAPEFSSVESLDAAGTRAVSEPFTPPAAGTYRVVATYGGDADYTASSSLCTDPTEAVSVDRAALPIATQVAPAAIALGSAFRDTASLGTPPQGGPTPTGSVRFDVYGPNDPTCTAPPALTSTGALDPDGTTAASSPLTPTGAGAYRVVATYGGDPNYEPVSSSCTDPAEAVAVSRASLPITTHVAPRTITLGASFDDTATLGSAPTGATLPTGSVSFAVYGPGDPTCSAAPVLKSTQALDATGTTAVSGNFTPTGTGTYRVVATYTGDSDYDGAASSCADPAEAVDVGRAPLPIATAVAPPSITLGGSFADTATLGPRPAGSAKPSGTVTFDVYRPGDATCAGPALLSSTDPVDAAGTGAMSADFQPTTTGTHRVVATYSGDADYTAATSSCSDPAEAVAVGRAPLPIRTAVTPSSIALGASFTDAATLGPAPAGEADPTGPVTFDVYGPTDATCSAGPVFTSTDPISAAGTTAGSDSFTPTSPGTYRVIATYPGDADYDGSSSSCADPAEAVSVSRAPLPLTTADAPGTITLGGTFADTATIGPPPAGGPAPTGTVMFAVYPPTDSTCTGRPVFSSANPVDAAGTSATSDDFKPTVPGSYRTTATFSGDADYLAASSSCDDPAETVAVTRAPLPIATAVTPSTLVLGGTFEDTATLGPPPTGQPAPTGRVGFDVYGPTDTNCSSAPVLTASNPLTAGGPTVASGRLTPAVPGTYRVIATYGGDADYLGSTSLCSDLTETVTVAKATLPITTSASPATLALGGSFKDTATVGPAPAGAPAPTGAVTFDVYGPSDQKCSAAPVFSSTGALASAGPSAVSSPFTPTADGAYNVVASYAGDSTYGPSSSACGGPAQAVELTASGAGAGSTPSTSITSATTPTPTPSRTSSVPAAQPTATTKPPTTTTPQPTATTKPPTATTPQPATSTTPRSAATPPTASTPPGPQKTTAPTPPGGLGPVQAQQPGTTRRTGPELARYDARSEPKKVVGLEVAAFTILALAGGGGLALAGGAARQDGRADAASRESGRGAGGSSGAGAGANFDVDYEGVEIAELAAAGGLAVGDRSRTWRWPGTDALDAAAVTLPARLVRRSPLLARVVADGAYLRSILGSASLAGQLIGVLLGVIAVDQSGGRALPPSTTLTIVIAGLGVIDAAAGLAAVVTFLVGVVISGGLDSNDAVRTMMGLAALWFVVPIVAGAARPLRRDPPRNGKERYDRAADFAIASLIGAWAVQKIVIALPGLSGYRLPIGSQANEVALWILAVVIVRMLGEELATHFYPKRLVAVQPRGLGEPAALQRLAAALLRTGIFVFIAAVVVGSTWQLWVAGLLFLVPQAMDVYEERFPKSPTLGRALPEGLLEVVFMLFLLTGLGALLLTSQSAALIADSFVLLSIPAAALAILHHFGGEEESAEAEGEAADKGESQAGWAARIGGAAILGFGVLQVLGLLF